jgi:NitT/TauT family transport system substrate-binding protein
MVALTRRNIPFVFFSRAQNPDELKGKYVSISTFGSEPDIVTTLALRQLGLSRKDVSIVQMDDNARRFASLLAGYTSATLLAEPNITAARRQGLFPLVDFAGLNIPWVFTGLGMQRKFIVE